MNSKTWSEGAVLRLLHPCLMILMVVSPRVTEADDRVSGGFITVDGSRRFMLLPESLPPSTTRASLERIGEAGGAPNDASYVGEHMEIMWEPSLNTPLSKTVILEPGTWRISFFATSLQHPTNPFSDTSWSFFVPALNESCADDALSKCRNAAKSEPDHTCAPDEESAGFRNSGGTNWQLIACAFRRVGTDSQRKLPPAFCHEAFRVHTPGWVQVKIWGALDEQLKPTQLLAQFGQRGEVTTPLSASARGFSDTAATATSDLFQAVADVALERVEISALESVRERLLSTLCDHSIEGLVRRAFPQVHWEDGVSPPQLLPRTCNMLRRVRLQELATASSGLQLALKQDLTAFGATLLTIPLGQSLGSKLARSGAGADRLLSGSSQRLAAIIGGVALLLPLAMEPESSEVGMATSQLVVRQFVDFIHQELMNKATDLWETEQANIIRGGLVIAATAIAACHASNDCDSHIIRRYIEHPEKFFTLADPGLERLAETPEYVALHGRLVSIVNHALSVMSPRSRSDSRRSAMEASAMVFEVLDLLVEARYEEPRERVRRKQQIQSYREMADALLKQDFSLALVAAGAIAVAQLTEQPREEFDRKVRYASAFANYLHSYPSLSSLNGKEHALSVEEQRRLRRQAISTLVDLAGDRSQQVGEWSVALEVVPGARVFKWSSTRLNTIPAGVHLSLPLGVAVERSLSEHWRLGFHAFVFDLGQYAAIQDAGDEANPAVAEPLTALAPALSFGANYRNWSLLIDARYAPNWKFADSQARKDVSLGLTLGYQVPLLWLH